MSDASLLERDTGRNTSSVPDRPSVDERVLDCSCCCRETQFTVDKRNKPAKFDEKMIISIFRVRSVAPGHI